jgi:putative ATPase
MAQPLADLLRPQTFDQMVGQTHLVGKNGALRRMLEQNYLTNMIFYGPPGTGKTTAARIMAKASGKPLHCLNATTASLADVREVIAQTQTLDGMHGVLLYLDEIQYFNKKQQQSLLEYMESGELTLIASTTENPYLYVYNAVLSRSAVFEFHAVTPQDIAPLMDRAVARLNETSGAQKVLCDDAKEYLANAAAGDVRRALNLLENAFYTADTQIDRALLESYAPKCIGNFDAAGTVHYDLLSALQKSIRGSDPDATIFYLCKILEGGDLPGACRRLQVIASEDIGLAYPQAAAIVRACVESAKDLGMPEARIPLAHAALLLATAPKSNSAEAAYDRARVDVEAGKGQTLPTILRPSHRFENYLYPHNYPHHYVRQDYLPRDLAKAKYYEYGENKTEQAAKSYWDLIKGEEKK